MSVIEWTIVALILALSGEFARRAWQAKKTRDAIKRTEVVRISPEALAAFAMMSRCNTVDYRKAREADRPEDYCA